MADNTRLKPVQASRGYQLEMFEKSMEGNIVITIDTGSGKTHIAKLRIEAEVNRSPDKLVWLTTPSVVLAQQQYEYLTQQLPASNFRLITGLDHVQCWSTRETWNGVLDGIQIVVSTPQILLDALTHGFVRLDRLSLLVVDEAHHCMAGEPTNRIMQTFYHPQREHNPDLPHILGLTASPITRSNVEGLDQLEKNMNAICRAPTLQLDEYRQFVHLPEFVTLDYSPSESPDSPIAALECLAGIVDSLDPAKALDTDGLATNGRTAKLEKVLHERSKALFKQIRQLQNHAQELRDTVGAYAANMFMHECLSRLHSTLSHREALVLDYSQEEKQYLDKTLSPVAKLASMAVQTRKFDRQRSAKVNVLIRYLTTQFRPGICCVIFVKRRSTAWALQHVLSLSLPEYNVTSFVGMSNNMARKSTLTDLADVKGQWQGLVNFRRGERNVCVATQVLEEGVDVQATNMVVRFDDPENVRSFIQSRGRARHASSKFVLLRDTTSLSYKYSDWDKLEQKMKARYMDDQRQLEERLATEDIEEVDNRRYSVDSSGATLSPSVAVGHLHHFCQSSICSVPGEGGNPEYIFSRDVDLLLSVRVVLPVALHPDLRKYEGSKKWKTERSAKRDVSFVAYVSLHKAGLINDNLLPNTPLKVSPALLSESRESICQVRSQIDPWLEVYALWHNAPSIYLHEINVRGKHQAFPPLLLGLPMQLASPVYFPLYYSEGDTHAASIELCTTSLRSDLSIEQARRLTLELLMTVLGRRFGGLMDWHGQLAYLLIPTLNDSALQDWQHAAESDTESILVRYEHESIPFVVQAGAWNAACVQAHDTRDEVAEVQATRLTRRIDFLKRDQAFELPQARALPVAECHKLVLPVPFAQLALFLPAILFMAEAALRAQQVCSNILQQVGFRNTWRVAEAMTLPAVHASINYERLEWLGDTLLKYYAAVAMYCDKPLAPEGQLTIEVSRLTGNLRLHKAALAMGIEGYIASISFGGAHWKPIDYSQSWTDAEQSRSISTKTVADVIEALLGAAFFDEEDLEQADQKAATFLSLAIPEVQWLSPTERLKLKDTRGPEQNLRHNVRKTVENLVGYPFQHPALIVEALNHSSVMTSTPSYQRLEFLGDAVLQRIVNMTLFQGSPTYKEGQLHIRQAALVNGDILAFFCLGLCHQSEQINVSTNPVNKDTKIERTAKKVGLWQFVTSSDNSGMRIEDCYDKYLALQTEITIQLDTGKIYPWNLLAELEAPKFLSDVVESILGAIFVDSGGSLEACCSFLDKLGLMRLVSRLAAEEDMVLDKKRKRKASTGLAS